jgi:fumarate reductase flavoprotein subunit
MNMSETEGLEDSAKRRLIHGAAAIALGSVLPGWRLAEAKTTAAYDVIVIGGGTAGMPLAIYAAARGARVLVVEKSPVLGGNLDRAEAQTSAAGTMLQKAKNISDSAESHFADIMKMSHDRADPVLTRLWTANAADTINWLISKGLEFPDNMPDLGANHAAYSAPRVQTPVGHGKAIIKVMQPQFDQAVASGKVTVRFNARVVELVQDNKGAVVGVAIQDNTGAVGNVMASNIVLASGGCMANPQLFQELQNVPLYWAAGYPFDQGDGLLLGQAAGGYLRGGEDYALLGPALMEDDAIPSVPKTFFDSDPVRRPPWEIWVNARGERFVREDVSAPPQKENALKEQPAHRMWAVHDEEGHEKVYSALRGWSREKYDAAFGSDAMLTKAPNLHELGLKAGVNPYALQATVARYNAALATSSPDPLGREFRPAPIAKPPFYAVRLQGFTLVTRVGLAVDYDLRVVRADGTPVPNLYACGEVIGGAATQGDAWCTGTMITPALTLGRLLGQRILKFPGKAA